MPHECASATRIDRRAEAVRARRDELEAQRRLLTGGHRADLRAALDLARLAASDELTTGLERMRAGFDDRIGRLGADGLARVPGELAAELSRLGRCLDDTFAEHAGPPLRRIAASRCPGSAPLPVPEPERSGTAVLAGAAPSSSTGAAGPAHSAVLGDPRVLGVLAGLPVLAAGGFGWSTVLVTSGVAILLGCLVRARVLAERRTRLRAYVARAVTAAATAGERETHRRVIRLETAVGAVLDAAVRRRGLRITAELAELDEPAGPEVCGAAR